MAQPIDFLPDRYHEQSEGRRSQLFRVAAICLFGTAILAAAVWQWNLRRLAAADLAAVTAQFDAAQAINAQLDVLHQQLRRTRAQATRYAYLRHPWPTTRVLAAIVGPLPDSICLTELKYVRGDLPAGAHPSGRGANALRAGDTTPAPVTSGAGAAAETGDLARLRAEAERLPRVVQMTGQTTDPAAVHRYLAALGNAGLFEKVELSSLESLDGTSPRPRTEFRTRLLLRSPLDTAAEPSAPQTSQTAGPGVPR